MQLPRALVVVVAVWVATAIGASGQRGRRDVADLARYTALVRELYPELAPSASVRATLETLDDSRDSPRIGLRLYKNAGRGHLRDGVGLVPDPEEQLYEGAVAFTAAGQLDAYSGRTREGELRFAALERRLDERPLDEATFSAGLRESGAVFVDRPPTVETCRSLAAIVAAMGADAGSVQATRTRPAGSTTASRLGREQLAWRLSVDAKRAEKSRTYWLVVDQWGEVLSVSRDGRPFP